MLTQTACFLLYGGSYHLVDKKRLQMAQLQIDSFSGNEHNLPWSCSYWPFSWLWWWPDPFCSTTFGSFSMCIILILIFICAYLHFQYDTCVECLGTSSLCCIITLAVAVEQWAFVAHYQVMRSLNSRQQWAKDMGLSCWCEATTENTLPSAQRWECFVGQTVAVMLFLFTLWRYTKQNWGNEQEKDLGRLWLFYYF